MKKWKDEKMEGWKDEKMEGWKDERMLGDLWLKLMRRGESKLKFKQDTSSSAGLSFHRLPQNYCGFEIVLLLILLLLQLWLL